MRIRIRIRIRTRIRIRLKTTIRTWIMIRTYCLKAKGQEDIKLQAARLIWPGGMSGAPEFNSLSTLTCTHTARC